MSINLVDFLVDFFRDDPLFGVGCVVSPAMGPTMAGDKQGDREVPELDDDAKSVICTESVNLVQNAQQINAGIQDDLSPDLVSSAIPHSHMHSPEEPYDSVPSTTPTTMHSAVQYPPTQSSPLSSTPSSPISSPESPPSIADKKSQPPAYQLNLPDTKGTSATTSNIKFPPVILPGYTSAFAMRTNLSRSRAPP